MVKFLVAEAVFPEYLPINQAVERRAVGLFKVVYGYVGLELCRQCTTM